MFSSQSGTAERERKIVEKKYKLINSTSHQIEGPSCEIRWPNSSKNEVEGEHEEENEN